MRWQLLSRPPHCPRGDANPTSAHGVSQPGLARVRGYGLIVSSYQINETDTLGNAQVRSLASYDQYATLSALVLDDGFSDPFLIKLGPWI